MSKEVFGVKGYPTHVLVDHAGLMIYRESGWGPQIQSELDAKIEQALRRAE